MNVIPVGATVNEIVNVATYTAVQAPVEVEGQPRSRYPSTVPEKSRSEPARSR